MCRIFEDFEAKSSVSWIQFTSALTGGMSLDPRNVCLSTTCRRARSQTINTNPIVEVAAAFMVESAASPFAHGLRG
jgi:hypothetical protein